MIPEPPSPPIPRPGAGRLRVLTALLRRLQGTRGRLVLVGVVAGALALAALAINLAGGGRGAVVRLLTEPVLVVAVPLTAMVFAVAALGDLREDGTLVYVWLRPLPRWQLAGAAVAASLQLVLPLNLAGVAAVLLLGGQADLLAGAAAAVTLGSLAYVALFVALGLRTQRSLLWGLGYLLLVEGFLSRFSDAIAAVSVRRYVAAVLGGLTGATTPGIPVGRAVAALALITALGLGLTLWWLRSRDVP